MKIGGTGAYTSNNGILLDGPNAQFAVGNASGNFLRFNHTSNKLEINTDNFDVNASGDVTMTGDITATGGTIGGFAITSAAISSSNDTLILRSTGQVTASSLLLTGGQVAGMPVSSDEIAVGSVLKLKDSGQITGSKVLFSGGEIGGFELSSDEIKSSNNNLRLKDSGQITGSTVLFTGGTIGGFELAASQLNSSNDNLILKDSGQITGSNVLFDGGEIGGFDITADQIRGGLTTTTQTSQSVSNTNVSCSM